MDSFSDTFGNVEPVILEDKVLDNGLRYVRAIPQGGVCSQMIEVLINGEVIEAVRYTGGCSGNTQGVAALVKGMSATEAAKRIEGIQCGGNITSCPDQLSKVLKFILNKK